MHIRAEDTSPLALGIRLGVSTHTEKNGFMSYEVFGIYGIPWTLRVFSNWILSTRLNASIGIMTQGNDTGFFATLSPGIAISPYGGRLMLDTGGGLAITSKDKLGHHDFGGPFLFAAHGGISYEFPWNLAIGYRFFHLSDGGIYNGHGLNRHLLELSYHF
ncbi:MAG: acyloxyacyl hydrolase [Candidatus Bathyarchaeia archaeon]